MSNLDQALGRLVSRLTHDVRSPLAAVVANLRFLEGSDLDTEEREAVVESLASAKRITAMLDDVVRLEQLKKPLDSAPAFETVALADLGQEVRDAARFQLGRRQLDISLPDASLCTDRQLLLRVLVNLVEHALRHTPPRGTVRLQGESGRTLTLSVEDEGLPFDDEMAPSFMADDMPLRQAPRDGFRSDQGIELYFAGTAARALGARTSVAPRADGSGVRFELELEAAR
jgi:signal transduction histidine kinase